MLVRKHPAGNRDFSIKTVDAKTVCPHIREIQETLAIDATDEGDVIEIGRRVVDRQGSELCLRYIQCPFLPTTLL